MDDTISRQWLMECVEEGWIKFDTQEDENRFVHLIRDIAPSAQQWIPCDMRLPDPGVNVLVDVADIPAGGRFPLIDEICKDGEWLNCDGSEWLALAWMPIPDPWKGEQNGEKR